MSVLEIFRREEFVSLSGLLLEFMDTAIRIFLNEVGNVTFTVRGRREEPYQFPSNLF